MSRLASDEIDRRLAALQGWTRQGDAIRKTYTFGSFPEAVSFVVRIAFAAEQVDHHPDILINYRRVTLTYTTHSAGGLTEKDFAGAQEADRIAWV
ncbi:MAG TPA: 4a-hydroxytetrahydrobiopterin dehydratase [Vicinamibacterales bacterium]|nr:4a-hydroxytetrahydrobiopterin dehydratase [Vicinamibacterales bacterium]